MRSCLEQCALASSVIDLPARSTFWVLLGLLPIFEFAYLPHELHLSDIEFQHLWCHFRASIGFGWTLKGGHICVEGNSFAWIIHPLQLACFGMLMTACIWSTSSSALYLCNWIKIQAFRYIIYKHLNGLHRGIKGASGWMGVCFCHRGPAPFQG